MFRVLWLTLLAIQVHVYVLFLTTVYGIGSFMFQTRRRAGAAARARAAWPWWARRAARPWSSCARWTRTRPPRSSSGSSTTPARPSTSPPTATPPTGAPAVSSELTIQVHQRNPTEIKMTPLGFKQMESTFIKLAERYHPVM